MELFYQVFDKGMLEDGEGREIDFKNTVIILTTNAATDTMMKLCADPETAPEPEKLVEAIKPELNKIFKPAFLGRMVDRPLLPDLGRGHEADHQAPARADREPAPGEPRRLVQLRRHPSSTRSPAAARRSRAARATSTTS